MATLEKSDLFPARLSNEIFNAVKGFSSLATLCASTPVRFNGNKEFIFTMDNEIDFVAESGKKGVGGSTITPVTILPFKVEYSSRVTDEFMRASEEEQMDLLQEFIEGFGRQLAKGLDIGAFHGINPRTGLEASTTIKDNCFDKQCAVSESDGDADEMVEDAINVVQETGNDVTGIIMAPALRTDLAKLTDGSGSRMYPELAWGAAPSVINGLPASVNTTVDYGTGDLAIVGDFTNAFKWGYAQDIFTKVIEYGNPDNNEELGDLQGCNQVLIRAEAYIGWGILDPTAFAIIKAASGGNTGNDEP